MDEACTARSLKIPEADVGDVLSAPGAVVVDLRSPAEFAADHLPGARSVPLFDDVERALIGTLYKQVSPDEAFAEGRARVEKKIRRLMERIAELAGWGLPDADLLGLYHEMTAGGLRSMEEGFAPGGAPLGRRPVVLHCWRGGLRSRSVVGFARRLGLDAVGLRGGYKAYRRHVLAELDRWEPPRSYVLRGLTGVGKTLVLRELERIRPGWTVDLEHQAGHRSSLLGMVGLEPCSQRRFESRLAERLRAGFPGPAVFEGESRKVGDAIIPPRVWEAMGAGGNVLLSAGVERRVAVLMEDYLAKADALPQLGEQLAAVEARMTPRMPLVELFDAGRYAELVRALLEHYYDPLYRHSEAGKTYAVEIDASDVPRAARELAAWIEDDRASRRGRT